MAKLKQFNCKQGFKKASIPLGPIKFRCALNNTIMQVLRNRGWFELGLDDENFDFYWCTIEWMRDNFDRRYLPDHVRLCHFRNHFELTRKNLMVKNLKRLRKRYEKESGKKDNELFNFIPTTFELPMEYHMFLEEFRKSLGSIWIMKPVAKSQGKGIFLFRRIKEIEAWKRGGLVNYLGKTVDGNLLPDSSGRDPPEHYVVSRYIDNPYLISGRKFDLRVYVLVTSFQPLKAWVYRDGFARLSSTAFSLDSIDDHYVHLTNVAIQKTAPDYDAEKGCKWSVCRLRRFMIAEHGFDKVNKLFRDIDTIFIGSLISVSKIMINDKHCFELYGYDILLDADLKPWLLEINASPSLSASSQEDKELKMKLLDDTLSVIDMEGKLTGLERRVGDFDCIWDDGPVAPETTPCQTWISNVLSSIATGVIPASLTGTNAISTANKDAALPASGSNGMMNSKFYTGVTINQNSSNMSSQSSLNVSNTAYHVSSILPIPPLNSNLGCLQMRRKFDRTATVNKHIQQITSRRLSHVSTLKAGDVDLNLPLE